MKHKISFLLFVCTLTFISCKESSNPVVPYTGQIVLVSGMENNSRHDVAKYWSNGTPTNLSDTSNDALAQSIYMVGNHLCAVGYQSNGNRNVATRSEERRVGKECRSR